MVGSCLKPPQQRGRLAVQYCGLCSPPLVLAVKSCSSRRRVNHSTLLSTPTEGGCFSAVQNMLAGEPPRRLASATASSKDSNEGRTRFAGFRVKLVANNEMKS